MFKLITGILYHGHPVAMSHEYLGPLFLAVVTSQIGRVFVTVSVNTLIAHQSQTAET